MKSFETHSIARAASKHIVRAFLCGGSIIVLSMGSADPVQAQQVQAAQQAQDPPADQLQEVVITATRFKEDISKVPITVTAITGEQLEQRNIQNVDQLFQDTPGVTFYRTSVGGGANSQIVIRGIQSSTGAGTTGIYIDDTPIQLHKGGISFTAQNGYPDIFDLDRVEVLQGPQGTLFGSGAMGGAVRFITRQPSLDTYSVYAKVEQGFTEGGGPSYGGGLAVGGPIIENVLGFRFSADYHMDGGWVTHSSTQALLQQITQDASGDYAPNEASSEPDSNWRQTYAVRGALTFAPNDQLSITPSFTYQNVYQNAQSTFYDYYSNPGNGTFVNASGVNEPDQDQYSLSSLTAHYNFSGFSLFSSTAYYDRTLIDNYVNTACDIECTPAGFVPVSYPNYFPQDPGLATSLYDLNQQKNISQEIRAQSADASSNFTWQTGVFYARDVAKSQEFAPLSLSTINGLANALGYANYLDLFGIPLLPNSVSYHTLDLVVDTHMAVFGEVNYKVLDHLTLTVGARVENVKSALVSEQGGPMSGNPTFSGFAATVRETPVTPKFSAAYQIDDANMVYSTVAKGVRPGGSNGVLPSFCDAALAAAGLTGFNGNFSQDSVWSYEVGAKDKFRDNTVSIQSSLYWIDWSKIQESQNLTGSCIHTVTFNGNSLTSKGVAIQGQALIASSLTLSGSIGYDDARFTKPSYGAPGLNGQPTILINAGDGIDGAPPVTASLAMEYDRQLFERPSFVRLDGQYISKENMLATTDPTTTAYYPGTLARPVTHVANFRAGMTFDRFQASVFVTNLTDSHPVYQAQNAQQDGVTTESITIRPRTVGVTGIFRF